MAEIRQFRLPDVGEGLTEADIVKWHVQPGDAITVNQIIVEIETAKAVVELPSPYAGIVADLLVAEGVTADVGTPIISVNVGASAGDTGDGASGAAAAGTARNGLARNGTALDGTALDGTAADGTAADGTAAGEGGPDAAGPGQPDEPAERTVSLAEDLVPPPPAEPASPPAKDERQAVLVGYGVKLGSTARRARKPAADARPPAGRSAGPTGIQPASALAAQRAASAPGAGSPGAGSPGAGSPSSVAASTRGGALAKPPVRKMARDLGVDLSALAGTGPHGSITRDDVLAATDATTATEASGVPAAAAGWAGPAGPAGREATTLPREERIAIRGVRRHTAAAVAASAFTAPHVTEFLQIDITETMRATSRLRALPEFAGLRVSPLLLVARALLVAVARHPMINASWDDAAQEIVVRHYVNLGIAAATGRGLVVPNIKDAQARTLPELASALGQLAETARAGKSTLADLSGGTITITNVGVFGVDTGTPILTPGESAILAFGQVKDAPWVVDGQLAVRQVCTLALSFDHRVADGDLGSAVLSEVGAMLTDPLRILAWS
ncbi:MAG: dihydrolipoamide acetyltransferase family protein [Streptosporangiaceae bacterium]|jgi:2-oxoisovalerate dehydrogenase E2 component (dihydrolipoyl transacylase)